MASAHHGLGLISSEHIVGASVYDPGGKEIGQIDHLMVDPQTGRARYAVVNFCGFMCLRPGHQVVPWSTLCYDSEKQRYTSEVTAEQLEKAPELDPASWTDRDWEMRVHAHFGASPYWESAAP